MLRGILLAALSGVVLLLVVWFGGAGPRAFLPGGVLWGDTAPIPSDWSFTHRIAEVQVETRRWGFFPWSVITWVMADGPTLYIGASECDRVWTRVVEQHPDVRVRIDGRIYPLRMQRVDDPEVTARIAPIVLHKYMGIAVDTANWNGESTGCMFRLGPRT